MDPAKPLADILADLRRDVEPDANFELLFRRFHGQVYRFFLRRGTPAEDCRDLTQEVFLAVYRGVANLQNEGQFTAWLFTIARNASINAAARQQALKRDAVQVFPAPGEETGAAGMDAYAAAQLTPLEDLIDTQKHSHLVEALAALPTQMRRCVQLRIINECSYEEIALAMSISVNTVKAHLHQARRNLKDKLAPYFSEVEVP